MHLLALLLAFQLSTTHCTPDAVGGLNCTTMSPAPMPDMSKESGSTRRGGGCGLCNLISIIGGDPKKRHAKEVGKMLSKGDCVGAEAYAVVQGEIELAERVHKYCATNQTESDTMYIPETLTTPILSEEEFKAPNSWKHVATAKDGAEYYTDLESLQRNGSYRSVWEIIEHPATDSVRETRALNKYNCAARMSAVEMLVQYMRDGNIKSETVKPRDLEFVHIVPDTLGDASYRAVCPDGHIAKH